VKAAFVRNDRKDTPIPRAITGIVSANGPFSRSDARLYDNKRSPSDCLLQLLEPAERAFASGRSRSIDRE